MNPYLAGALGALAVLAALALAGAVLRRLAWRRSRRRGAPGLAWVLRRIGARPEQERAVLAEADAVVEALRALGADARALREDLAELLSLPELDAARVGVAVDARLGRLGEVRSRLSEAVARIHAALDPAQRSGLAAVVRDGRRAGCRGRLRGAHA